VEAVQGLGHAAGYVNACGTTEARKAVAAFHSSALPSGGNVQVTAEQVVLANGCSGYVDVERIASFSALLSHSVIADHLLHYLVSFSKCPRTSANGALGPGFDLAPATARIFTLSGDRRVTRGFGSILPTLAGSELGVRFGTFGRVVVGAR
jgi:hypothetical protein